jgi:L-rhamnose isomerase
LDCEDLGQKINTVQDLKKNAEKANFNYVVQDLIPYKNEVGFLCAVSS